MTADRGGTAASISRRIHAFRPYNRMQMQLGSEAQIPDGLLAANALLAENSRQGFGASTHTVYQGFGIAISSTALGISGTLYDGRVRCRCTGKERDAESGLDYFGARYYASSMGRWTSPDPLNLTDERLLNPQTLNKYGYAADNPLKYIDTDGKDITYFYDPGGTAGHAVLFAYNQATGDSALESFGPNIHAPVGLGVSNFDMNEFSSAQGLRDNYVSLTIQTNPELTQEVITYIRSNPDPSVWGMTGPNCSTQCGKILQKFKLDYQKSLVNRNLTPKFLFKNLMKRYNPGQSTSNPKQGQDYGAPRADMYQLLWNHINPDNFSVTTSQQDSKNGVPIAPCGGDNPCNK